MAINIDYTPAAAVEQMGFLAGRGDFNRWLADQQFRAAQMAQQGNQFQQQQALRENALVAEQQQQAYNAANRNATLQWNRQNELADRENQQNWQAAVMGQRQQWDVAEQQAQQAATAERMQQMAAFGSAEQGGDALEKEIGGTLTTFAKQKQYLTPEGVNVLNKLQGEFQARRKVRDWGNPQAHAQALGDLAQQIQRADLQQYLNVPKPSPEAFAEETVETAYGIMGRDRSGAWRKVAPPPTDPRQDWLNKNLKNFEDPDTKEIDIDRAMRAYEKIQAWQANQMAAAEGFPVAPVPPEPPPRPTVRTAKTFEEYWQALPPDKREALERDSATRLKPSAADGEGPPSHAAVMEDVRKRLVAIHGFKSGEPAPTAEQEQAIFARFRELEAKARSRPEGIAALDVQRARQEINASLGIGEAQPKPETPRKLDDLRDGDRQLVEKYLPRPQTRADRDKLPKGTSYIAPDGSLNTR